MSSSQRLVQPGGPLFGCKLDSVPTRGGSAEAWGALCVSFFGFFCGSGASGSAGAAGRESLPPSDTSSGTLAGSWLISLATSASSLPKPISLPSSSAHATRMN